MVRIIPAEPAHLPEISALEQACFSRPWSLKSLGNAICDPNAAWLVAERGGTVAGYIGMQFILDEGTVTNLAVRQDCRRCGVASLLLEAALERAERLSLSTVALEVRESNLAARKLYASHGFEQCGLRRGYYSDPDEDALILIRTLSLQKKETTR